MTQASPPREAEKEDEHFGLKDDWHSIEETLGQIIPVYDKTNRFISLGTDLKVRKSGISLLRDHMRKSGKDGFSVLDIGSGRGKMTEMLLSLSEDNEPLVTSSVMLDALGPMMRIAKKCNKGAEGLLGIYENLPIKNCTFSATIAGFATRDARNLSEALSEVNRVLESGGYFLIVDLAHPDSRTKGTLLGIYWVLLAPFIAFLAAGRLGLKFGALYTTYRRLPRNAQLLDILRRSGFEVVEARFRILDGVCILLLRKRP